MNVKDHFPFFRKHPDLVYLDSAATAQKLDCSLETFQDISTSAANIHRGAYPLSLSISERYEDARSEIADFIGATPHTISFSKNATESLNLVTKQFKHLTAGDVIVTSVAEHHSNFLPWMRLAEETGATLDVLPVLSDGNLDLHAYETILQTGKVRIVALTAQSNVLGKKLPVKDFVKLAHKYNAKIVIDGTQHIVHHRVNVTDLDCDYYAFSGHKLYSVDGVGVLYAKHDPLYPLLLGGGMVASVQRCHYTLATPPHSLEAGTPPIASAIALGETVRFLKKLNWHDLESHQHKLLRDTLDYLRSIDGIRILGKPDSGCISFVIDGKNTFDLATLLGEKGICVRSGLHCTEPLHQLLDVDGSIRVSFGIYSQPSDVEQFCQAMNSVLKML